jgi:hypothetical protein
MTSEEISKVKEEIIDSIIKAFDIAAKTLDKVVSVNIGAVEDMVENEPSEDAISRAALLEELGEEPFNWNDSPREFQEVSDYQWFRSLVENAPSITTRKIRWIPCSERLPKKEKWCLVTRKLGDVTMSLYSKNNEYWKKYVIAWQELPEPYKEGEE